MKQIVLTAIASLFIPILTIFTRKRKYVVRAAFDVGSGATKMCVAVVETSRSKSVVRKVLYDDQTSILLRCDMSISKDGKTLSESILSKTETTLKNYLNLAIETYGATQFCGIATAVFRKARNGEAFLKSLKKLGLEIKLIDQEMEGRIGWQTAANAYSNAFDNAEASEIVSWDSGGGSFQITNRHGDMYGDHQGSATVTSIMLEVQKRQKSASPNPVRENHVLECVRVLSERIASKSPSWIHSESNVVAIGGRTCAFRICKLACGTNTYGPSDVMSALKRLQGKTDEELRQMGFPEVRMALPKLCLIYTVMKKCNISKLTYIRTNGSTLGVLVERGLWS